MENGVVEKKLEKEDPIKNFKPSEI